MFEFNTNYSFLIIVNWLQMKAFRVHDFIYVVKVWQMSTRRGSKHPAGVGLTFYKFSKIQEWQMCDGSPHYYEYQSTGTAVHIFSERKQAQDTFSFSWYKRNLLYSSL